MRLYRLLATLLFILGIAIFLLRVGSGHSLTINDLNSFVTIVSPFIFILSSLLLLGYPNRRKKGYFINVLKISLIFSMLSIMYIVYDFLSHWRNNGIYFTVLLLLLVIFGLMARLLFALRPSVQDN